MLEGIKRSWRQLKAGEPGHRFQSQYEAQKKSRRPGWVRPVWLAAGTVIMAVGVVALPAPGPGFLVIGMGAALVARESRTAARILDWIELRLRAGWNWVKDAWAGASWPVKVLILLICGATVVAFGWFAAGYFLGR